ncbi:hypothetical protein [Pacificibacter marinus]|uniref:hypothetical protein n=1 Tax=Pacificibacter marinus TaxID=658057 RepID=UPI001C07DB35|nr:hypothetical protein [Pacificibacter marinus]MBU2867874.1 hypothetical protein [Pacificibacter marinus]
MLDPKIIQGILTFSGALVASCSALWIAYRAYPSQKQADRALQKEHERRDVYRRFLRAANVHYASISMAHWSKNADPLKSTYLDLVAVLAELGAYVPADAQNDVLSACQKYSQRILEYGVVVEAHCGVEPSVKQVQKNPNRYPKDLSKRIRIERKAAFIAIRRDLGESVKQAAHAANVYFVATSYEETK